MANNVIVSGSTDRTLKVQYFWCGHQVYNVHSSLQVWNAESGTCVHTLYGHTSTVRCMHLHATKVVSGSRDATLRMWDVEVGCYCKSRLANVELLPRLGNACMCWSATLRR